MAYAPSPFKLRMTRQVLNRGGVIAYPTEAVYGLGCNPLNLYAVEKILQLKQRPADKGLILIGSRLEHLQAFTEIQLQDNDKLRSTWPGAVTWILPARPEVPYLLRGRHSGIAMRLTDHPVAAAICDYFDGAIVSTSANIATHPALRTATAVHACFGQQLDLVLHGDTNRHAQPSEIRDYLSGGVLRPA